MEASLENIFRKNVRKYASLKNAYLLVYSDKLNIHLNIAEGSTGSMPASPHQPYYIASVGKLFTSVLTSILYEQRTLSFEDNITGFLDHELVNNLHIYQNKDYTNDIQIKHLLNHTSGLYDHWDPLLTKLLEDPDFAMQPREVVIWSKNNLQPHCPPGTAFHYSDTNYLLLGLIIENITGMPFHDALKQYIFQPLDMYHSYMFYYSEPMEKCSYPIADFYIRDTKLTNYYNLAGIDYAGGGIVSTGEDLWKFMKSLVKQEIIKKETFEQMKDWAKYSIGINYGYGLMNFYNVPLLIPKKYRVWGNAGITGSFAFYHPEMEAYLIGNLNQFYYNRKGIRLMFKIINELSKQSTRILK